jgi:hypothetical protein
MSATNPTFGEIRMQCRKRFAGQVDADVLDSLINERYRRALRRLDWQRLKVQAWLETVVPYETGTLAVSEGGTALVGTDTVWTAAMTGRSIRIAGRDEWYTFTRTGALTGTIDRAYEGDDETAASYSIWKNVYVLPAACFRLLSMRILGDPQDLDQVSQEALDEMDPSRSDTGTPQRYALHQDDSSSPPCQQVELHPVPDEEIGIPYWYTQDPTLFANDDTGDFIAPWLNPDEIYLGVESDVLRLGKDYSGAQLAEALHGGVAKEDNQAECRRIGPQPLKMASMYTRHNRRRWSS